MFLEFSVLSSITCKELFYFPLPPAFFPSPERRWCALTVLTFPTSLCDIHAWIQPVYRVVVPTELQENVVRTWTKALESLVKLMLREVDDAFLCGDRLFGVSREVLVTWEVFWRESTAVKQISEDTTVVFLNEEWSNKSLLWGLNSVHVKASSDFAEVRLHFKYSKAVWKSLSFYIFF